MKDEEEMMQQYRFVPIGDLKPTPHNPKKHDVPAIKSAIRTLGFKGAILINEDMRVIAGHGRLQALLELHNEDAERPPRGVTQTWKAPCIIGDFENEGEAHAFLLADNRIQELAGYDDEALAQIAFDIPRDLVAAAGYDAKALDKIQKALAQTTSELDPTPQLSVSYEYKVVISCRDEEHQIELMERFKGEGMECQPLLQ